MRRRLKKINKSIYLLFSSSSNEVNEIFTHNKKHSQNQSETSSLSSEESAPSDNMLIQDNILAYQQLHQRFNKKKTLYTVGQEYYTWSNFLFFTIPLLIMQIVLAIMPSILTSTEDANTLKIIITSLSAISAAFIALQSKLKYDQIGEKYNNIAAAYGLLASDAYFELSQAKIKHKIDLEENNHYDPEKNSLELLHFLEKSQKLEKHVMGKAPILPEWLATTVKHTAEKEKTMPKPGAENLGQKRLEQATKTTVEPREPQAEVKNETQSTFHALEADNNIASLYASPLEAYQQLFQRFSRKKQLYNLSAKRYKHFDLFIFIIPLLILQVCNAILPTILKDFASADTARLVTTIISALSAAFIAAQGKLRYGEIGENYLNVAGTYSTLVSDSYFQMTQANIKKFPNNSKEKIENFNDLKVFLIQSQRMIKNAKDGCPVIPRSIQKKVKNFELKKLEKERKTIADQVAKQQSVRNLVRQTPVSTGKINGSYQNATEKTEIEESENDSVRIMVESDYDEPKVADPEVKRESL